MSKERFQRTGKTSFYGNYLYGRVVPRGHFLPSLIESDLAQDLPIGTSTADRGYDDTDNHFFLQTRGIPSAIHLNHYRTRKKDPNTDTALHVQAGLVGAQGPALVQVPLTGHKPSPDKRYQIERKFGEAKQYHGLPKGCRYLGIWRYAVQAYMTAIAPNLKRLVRLLTGVPSKGKVPVMV